MLTDRFGRKLGLAVSVVGNLFVIAASTAIAGLHLANWRWLLLGTNILGGLCGGSGTTLMSAFAYVADTHPEAGRANAFTAVEATYVLCSSSRRRCRNSSTTVAVGERKHALPSPFSQSCVFQSPFSQECGRCADIFFFWGVISTFFPG